MKIVSNFIFLIDTRKFTSLPLSMTYASLAFRTLSLLDLMSSSGIIKCDVVSRVIISKKVF